MAPSQVTAWSLLAIFSSLSWAADPDFLGLTRGYIDFETDAFTGKIVNDTQILVSLVPKSDPLFDFLPFDYMNWRADNGNHHIGDITFRYRVQGNTTWVEGSSAVARKNLTTLEAPNGGIARANLAPTLNSSLPLDIVRTWGIDGNDLTVSFNITNTHSTAVEIGALGFPIENNNIFYKRSKASVQVNCSFADPYIGLDAGYVQITRPSGLNPALIITPLGDTKLEAWNFLFEFTQSRLRYQSNQFEGFYEWEVYSKALADDLWDGAQSWNPPTSRILQPRQSVTHGLRLSLSQKIQDVGSVVASHKIPVATAHPGLILSTDMTAKLTIESVSKVSEIKTEPPNALKFAEAIKGEYFKGEYSVVAGPGTWGRVRVVVTYEDGKEQSVHYYIVKPGPQALADLGKYMNDYHWYSDESDAFGRGPSFMLVDHETNKLVLQDYRVWMVGLTHESGASWMVAAIKQVAQPNADQLSKLEQFVEKTLWDDIEEKPSYAVPYSLFWYTPNLTDFQYDPSQPWVPGNTYSWPKEIANRTNRAYGYVFPSVAYWSMYRVARAHPSLVPKYTWDFYLRHAYETVNYCFSSVNGTHPISFWNAGLMGETVIAEILKDLQREGWTDEAARITTLMRERATYWDSTPVPFTSEQPWDCTGQEGVYYWTNYFNYTSTVTKTISTIVGYMPTVAHWAYNGNARRYWDFNIGSGEPGLARIERQIHHYGSALNALPLLHHLRTTGKADTHLLRLAFGGSFAPLSNIQKDGFGSAAFHAFPETLRWDQYSGDYGPGFVGMMLGAATFVVKEEGKDETSVWGGDLEVKEGCRGYDVVPKDAVRMRVYIGPLGLWIEIDAGSIERVRVLDGNLKVLVKVAANVNDSVTKASKAVVWIENHGGKVMKPTGLKEERGGWALPLDKGSAVITIE